MNNFTRLQPTFNKLGVHIDTRIANSLMREEAGVAPRLLYSIKQSLSNVQKTLSVRRPAQLACTALLTFSCLHYARLTRHSRAHPPAQKYQHTGTLGRTLGASVSPSRGLLEAQTFNSAKEKYDSATLRSAARAELWSVDFCATAVWPRYQP